MSHFINNDQNIILPKFHMSKTCLKLPKWLYRMANLNAKFNAFFLRFLSHKNKDRIMKIFLHILTWSVKILLRLKQNTD